MTTSRQQLVSKLSIMHFPSLRSVGAVFAACLISVQLLCITDANPVHGDSSRLATGYRQQSGRKLVNLQRFIRNDPNLNEDYAQQFDNDDIGATTREPLLVPTTEAEFSITALLEQEASTTIETLTTSVIASDPSAQELPAPLPLDVDVQDTADEGLAESTAAPMSASLAPVIFDARTESANKEFDPETEVGTKPSLDAADVDEEMELRSWPNSTSDPRSSPPVTSAVPTPVSPDFLPLIAPVAAVDVSTEMSSESTTGNLEYSSFSSNEEEDERENTSSIGLAEMATEEQAEPHQSVSNSAEAESDEYYRVIGSTETVAATVTASKPLTFDIAHSTTEAPQQPSTLAEPLELLDFPLFYPARAAAIAAPVKEDLPAPSPPSAIWTPIIKTTSDSMYSVDQQPLSQHQSQLDNEMTRPQPFYLGIGAHQVKADSSQPPLLFPEVPNNSFYAFAPPSTVHRTIGNQQPKFRQQAAIDYHGPPRAPYPHPQENNESPFYSYRPFNSAPPRSRMLIFPPISSTRENFRFRVNWADQLMGKSDWA